jgi:hypothetical protein
MGVVTVTRIVLECDGDGCDATFGEPLGALNGMELRAAAYAAGWRFPNRLGKNGEVVTSTSDACPACAPRWKAREVGPGQRAATYAELRAWTPDGD